MVELSGECPFLVGFLWPDFDFRSWNRSDYGAIRSLSDLRHATPRPEQQIGGPLSASPYARSSLPSWTRCDALAMFPMTEIAAFVMRRSFAHAVAQIVDDPAGPLVWDPQALKECAS